MSPVKNRLLRKLAPSDFETIRPLLETVDLEMKQVIVERDIPIEHVYFPENCVCSILAFTEHVHPIEVGMIGFEGMSNFVVNYGDQTPLQTVVQVPGIASRMKARDFAKGLKELPSLNDVTLRYKEALAIQFAYTALSHGSFTIEERLARWLLMSHDRSQRANIPLVHEFVAAMLAVRRAGVTTSIHILEGSGAIKATRGTITIRDRDKLKEIANGSYGVPEAEYERLMTA
jgi:hypothetical protein